MKRIKKITAVLLAVCLIAGMAIVPSGVRQVRAAAVYLKEGDYTYRDLNDGTVMIEGYTGAGGAVHIPAELGGKTVSVISADTFVFNEALTELTIPAGVTDVAGTPGSSGAVGSTLEIFSRCTNLTGIHVDSGNTAFASEDGVLYNKEKTSLVRYPEGKAGDFVIPSGVTEIGGMAFDHCIRLTEVTVPSGTARIGDQAFAQCEALRAIRVEEGNPNYFSDDGVLYDKAKTKLIQYPAGKAGEYAILSSTTQIKDYAFFRCGKLTKIRIPFGVDRLENTDRGGIFLECTALADIQVDEANPTYASEDGVLFSKDKKTLLRYPGGKAGAYTIPSGVTDVGLNAFMLCKNLTEITVSSSVTNLGDKLSTYAQGNPFVACSALTNIYVDQANTAYSSQDGVLYSKDRTELIAYPANKAGMYTVISDAAVIGYDAFFGCVKLTGITIPSSVKSIGGGAFEDCTSLTEVTIPSAVKNIGLFTFRGCTNLTTVVLPSDLETIDMSAFENCSSLTAVTIPSGIKSIGVGIFAGCTNLTNIVVPDGVSKIGYGAFSDCEKLSQITIPDSVLEIETRAFYQCDSLKDVYYSGTKEQWGNIKVSSENILPDIESANAPLLKAALHTKETPDETADYDYLTLDDGTIEITKYKGTGSVVDIPFKIGGRQVTSIGEKAFHSCTDLTEVRIPDGVTKIGTQAFYGCTNLQGAAIPDGVASIGNSVFADCAALPQISIPNSVAEIGNSAFYGCTKLTEIVIPDGVTGIGINTFFGCTSLSAVHIPDRVTSIEKQAFDGCESLQSITIPNGVQTIGNGAFQHCSGLAKISLPESLTSISDYTFYACSNLTEINIPGSITRIGEWAFHGCEKLADVYYADTKNQWEKIQIQADGNESLQNAAIHYKEDQAPPDPVIPDEPVLPVTTDAKEELQRLKPGDPLSLEPDLAHYLSQQQMDILESCLFTWLADINYAYKYSGGSGVKERVMKKSGVDPQGDFASGTERAITHVSVETKYGRKTLEITLDLGKPDGGGNLYPSYGAMRYEILPKGGVPSDVPTSGQIGKSAYTDLAAFVESVSRTSDDSLHSIYQWQSLSDEIASGVLIDKTAAEIIGNKNGSFSDGIFTIYAKPLFAYSKKVTIACPVDVYVYSMDGKEAGSIIRNEPNQKEENVRLDVNGDTKTVYLTGNDYYLNLRGTDTGTMKYEVEEIANEEVCRNVQFLELQLKKDMQYEGYVFRPLNIDSDLYALRTVGGLSSGEVTYANKDSFEPAFKKVQGMSLSQQNTSIHTNKTIQLNASLFPLDATNPNLVWISDNPSVAAVGSDGLVTALGAGRATITVMTRDGSFLRQSCIVDVEGNKRPEPENPSDPDHPSTQPPEPGASDGTGTQPSRPGTPDTSDGTSVPSAPGSSSGTGTQPSQPVQPSDLPQDPPEDNSPVVAKLFYIIQFHANGGTNLSRRTMTLLNDDTLGILPKVQRKAYIFNGWYTQQTGGARVSGEKTLNEATTLYARWTKVKAPAKAAVQSLKPAKKEQVKVSFQKINGVKGYQVQYALNKKFTSAKTKTVGASAKAKTLTGLKAGKKYYVRVRAYTVDSMGNKVYGSYSAAKGIKIKA